MPPWKPGQSGNPAGRPKANREAEKTRHFKYEELIQFLAKAVSMTEVEFSEWAEKSTKTMMERVYGGLIKDAAYANRTDDRTKARQELSDRLFGKVKELVPESEQDVVRREIEAIPDEELIARIQKELKTA